MDSPSSSCDNPAVDFAALEAGERHRHKCHVLRRVCAFNGTLVPLAAGADAMHAQSIARTLIVRSQFGSHQTFPFAHLHPINVSAPGSAAAQLIKISTNDGKQLSKCVPLVWVPTWAFSFADSWVSSVVPTDELQSAALIDERVLLRPDLWAWPRSKNPVYRMLGSLSSEPTRSLREAAPVCPERAALRVIERAVGEPGRKLRHCSPHCYEKVLLCRFQSTFDKYTPPMSPWRTGQRVAASVIRGQPMDAKAAVAMSPAAGARVGDARYRNDGSGGVRRGGSFRQRRAAAAAAAAEAAAATAFSSSAAGRDGAAYATAAASSGEFVPHLRVLLLNRTRTKFSRSLANLHQLLDRCTAARPREWPMGWRVSCAAHEFGAGSLAADVHAARSADVLVGTHGAGLVNAFFMRDGAVLVEARPYRFEGTWPDRYFRALTALEQRIFYLQVSAASAALSIPRPKDDVSVWDARDHAVHLPWKTLKEVLQAAISLNSSRTRYLQRLWTTGPTFWSQRPARLAGENS